MIDAADILLKAAPEQVADERHQRLKAAEEQADDQRTLPVKTLHMEPLTQRSRKRIRRKADAGEKQFQKAHVIPLPLPPLPAAGASVNFEKLL